MYQGNQPIVGRFSKLDDISSQFNSVLTSFTMNVGSSPVFPGTAQNLIISLDGVLQEPGNAFTISNATITFSEAVPTGTQFFGILLGNVLNIGTPSDGAVGSLQLASGAVVSHLGYTPQSTLVSGTNIKTINSTTILGSGNVAVEPTVAAGTTSQYYRGDKSWQTLDKAAVALGNVDNTSDATKNSASVSLTNKTLSTGTVLGADVTGSDSVLTRTMLKDSGYKFYDSGATSGLDYVNGSHQRWSPSGSVTLSVSNWPPTGNLGELLIEGINIGAATITWPTVNWIKSDGTTTTTFSSNGVTLQTTGTDFIVLWTRDSGTTVYGKVVR